MLLDLHTELVYDLALDNNRLFSASLDKTVICWNANNGLALMIYYGHEDGVLSLSVQDDVLYSAGRDRSIIKWNIENGLILKTFPVYHAGNIRCFAHKGQVLFSGAEDASAIMWNSSTGEPLKIYSERDKQLNSIVLWKDFILSGGGDSNINAWDSKKDATSPTFVIVGHQDSVYSILIYEDSLFAGDSESLIRHWNLPIPSPLNILTG
jgi:WD40 repeat protein